MKIIKITKTGLFYKVKLEDDSVYKFHESVIVKYGFIRKNIDVSDNDLKNALSDNEYFLALDKGVKYLCVPRSKNDVRMHLLKQYDKDVVLKVLVKLEELKLINELEFAVFSVSLQKKKGYGRYKIIQDLKEDKICEEFITGALLEYSDEEEKDNCEKQLIKYLPTLKKESKNGVIKKIYNYLIGKGFSNEIITVTIEKNQEMVDNIVDEDENLIKLFNKLLKTKTKISDEKTFKNKVIRSLTSKGFPLNKILKLLEGDYD